MKQNVKAESAGCVAVAHSVTDIEPTWAQLAPLDEPDVPEAVATVTVEPSEPINQSGVAGADDEIKGQWRERINTKATSICEITSNRHANT